MVLVRKNIDYQTIAGSVCGMDAYTECSRKLLELENGNYKRLREWRLKNEQVRVTLQIAGNRNNEKDLYVIGTLLDHDANSVNSENMLTKHTKIFLLTKQRE